MTTCTFTSAPSRCQRQNAALQRLAVHGHALDAMLHSGGIVHRDVIGRPTEAAGHSEAGQGVRDAGVHLQSVQRGLDAQNILAHIEERPRRRAGQPAVLGLAKGGRIPAGYHLAVDIGLCAVYLRNILNVGRAGLAVDLKGTVAVAQNGLSAADPRVIVAENAGVLFVSRRIAGDLAQIELIAGVGRLMQHHAIFRIQPLFHALQRLRSLTALPANAGHNTHTLRFDKDLALRTLFAAHRLAKGIVGAAEPCSVPASRQRGLLHGLNALAGSGRFLIQMQVVAQFGVLPAILDEHTGDEHALGYRTLAGAGDLESSHPGARRSSSGSGSRSSRRGR